MSQTDLDTDIGTRFLGALATRDDAALGACFAADGIVRAIVPSGGREDDGREAITSRFRMWTEDAEVTGGEIVHTRLACSGYRPL